MSGILSILELQYVPLLIVIISFGLIIFYLLYEYEGWGEKNHMKVRKSVLQDDYECPRCGALVDGESTKCPECNAEFETDIYSCPVCGTTVSDDHDECPECEEQFVVDEKEFECPDCGKPVDQFDTECDSCGATFWSPVKRSDVNDEDEEDPVKKIDSSKIEIIDD
ncbi:MAG: zinc ribbon domain-containing protein [Candidatus Saliniplasma sp.]